MPRTLTLLEDGLSTYLGRERSSVHIGSDRAAERMAAAPGSTGQR